MDSDEFVLPVEGSAIDDWIEEMEAEASALWEDSNNPMCECGHRSDNHAWRDVANPRVAGEIDGFECEAEGCDCKRFKEDEFYGL